MNNKPKKERKCFVLRSKEDSKFIEALVRYNMIFNIFGFMVLIFYAIYKLFVLILY